MFKINSCYSFLFLLLIFFNHNGVFAQQSPAMYIGAAYYLNQLSIMLSKYGIKTFLATPISAIPKWI